MNAQNSRSQIAARRAELMAELFLQELEPQFISRSTSADLGYDLLVGFRNKKRGINTFAVEVKATERPPAGRFQIMKHTFDRLAHSNIPGLLLVADVKDNRLYYAWLSPRKTADAANVSIPLIELNETSRELLRAHVRSADVGVAAAG